ncbi:uncharacterized protein JN550_004008 [Neoarthrinium moseri]|uniref:uncharacterized protein n=1 Tax=Neoarthrinium moseri TaxID=1658444 RepID=UPI001FDB5C89|nr:uncharacterized protein JN550_004008 [Neoarthrinium moseri]KAI1872289.1 hypothetical protein JN550_004008 [Neoarthrinium moseri]
MFFQGTLQEGIATALQQSKQVVCFVTDGGDESEQWENDFLANDSVKMPLETQAVSLRLEAGSEEAGYLEALFPVPRKPTVIVIQNGQLREYIAAGTSEEEFLRRLGTALGGSSTQAPAPAVASSSTPPAHSGTSAQAAQVQVPGPAVDDGDDDDDLYGDVAPSSVASQPGPSSSSSQPPPHVATLLAERAVRLEAEKKAKEAAAKAEAAKRAQERREPKETDDGQGNISAAETKYASQLRKRKQEEKAERQRILQRIEDDKRERREREAQERQARLLLSATQDADAPAPGSAGQAVKLPSRAEPGSAKKHCNLQVRLLDGSTIRQRFPSEATLAQEVRGWIDETRTDGADPFSFRVLLAPLPNKSVDPAEEADSLLDLGLAPSATLILVPHPRAATAFQRSGGALYQVWAGIYGFLAMVLGFPLMLLGGDGRGPQTEHAAQGENVPLNNLDGQSSAREGQGQGQGARFRGFQNPDDRRRDQQLYNGNSLNFEPRNDEDEQEAS